MAATPTMTYNPEIVEQEDSVGQYDGYGSIVTGQFSGIE